MRIPISAIGDDTEASTTVALPVRIKVVIARFMRWTSSREGSRSPP